MDYLSYDITNEKSIEKYAKRLIGHTFLDVVEGKLTDSSMVAEEAFKYGNTKRKGGLGNLLEEVYFGYKANSLSEADFFEAGIELKVSPYEVTKKGEKRAGERLVLSMISYTEPIMDSLYESHVWEKCKKILLIYYLRNRKLDNNLLYRIDYVSFFTPNAIDLAIIENDYRIIAQKIKSGKAEQLSESDTLYLGACTKGATAESSIVNQYYPPYSPAKKRAYCYKNSYMTFVLNKYIVTEHEEYERIIHSIDELKNQTFEEIITSRINKYIGVSDKELCASFSREYNNNKAQWTDLAYRMLGIHSNHAEEFRKANICVKVIRLEENGKMRECMSFPPFKYKELIEEEWENSSLHNYFDETKFLFVVFKRKGNCYYLKGSQLWNMPYMDLNNVVQSGWTKVVETIKKGVRFTIKKTKSGLVVENNLPKKTDNTIVHVRPHASKRYYKFLDGTIIGDGLISHANELPDGTFMPNYSFWINNDYILSQLKK